jgi:hypothetical protein
MRLSLRERRTRDLVQCCVAGNPGRDDKEREAFSIGSGCRIPGLKSETWGTIRFLSMLNCVPKETADPLGCARDDKGEGGGSGERGY